MSRISCEVVLGDRCLALIEADCVPSSVLVLCENKLFVTSSCNKLMYAVLLCSKSRLDGPIRHCVRLPCFPFHGLQCMCDFHRHFLFIIIYL